MKDFFSDENPEASKTIIKPLNLAKLALATRLIKTFLSSILLYVNNPAKIISKSITKTQDECAYMKAIEDLSRHALRSSDTVYLMSLVPLLAHAGFIS